ncbi:poly-gamma-glutamate synthesis protein (capsule biosynthesis protein) [Scopulibacillus darangshiensis]|uniref:Poly-gamma-glutamate synthesis protein (Capsule biosynthesis protein) n=1 Tax=Scopulibacillus darangshiensis TaxID=442528 RepID=A0A4R2NHJ6_9BACL|nr:CapA family protein [Scopulibacillus darangshiensis]TCP20702.1 poly-gamma-glutamate synthesis protein (capsule biosynthesis protein) [Scopulibacillus darangshiensis]
METRKMTLAASGDSFITRRLPSLVPEEFQNLSQLLKAADVRFTNLEVTTHDHEGYPSAFSGGTWAIAPPNVLKDLKAYGFNLLAWANNHTMDYSEGGLFATERHLNQHEFIHAGVGRNLAEASKPKYLDSPGGRVALISATSTFHETWRAGNQRPDVIGRPGINPLRYKTTYCVTSEELNLLSRIADQCAINAGRNLDIKEGFSVPDPDGVLTFGNLKFIEGSEPKKVTEPLEADMKRIERAVKEARRQADIVIVSLHSHEMEGEDKAAPAEFFKTASRGFIDADADAVIGHGPHILRGIEIYKNKPIFYSLGNFIFQNDTVSALPADFYEKYGLDADANVADALDYRSSGGTKGLGTNKSVWESVIAMWEMEGGRVTKIKLYPISLGFGLPRYQRGWPVLSDDQSILERLQALSRPFGTDIKIEGKIGVIYLS